MYYMISKRCLKNNLDFLECTGKKSSLILKYLKNRRKIFQFHIFNIIENGLFIDIVFILL